MGVAKVMVARERAMARVNFILADGLVVVGLRLEKVLKNY
jgi:hypothetical protein